MDDRNRDQKLRALGYGQLEGRVQEDVQTTAGSMAEKLATAFEWVDPMNHLKGVNMVRIRQGMLTFVGYRQMREVNGFKVSVRSHAVVTLILPPGSLEEDKQQAPALVTSIARYLGAKPGDVKVEHGPLAARKELVTPIADTKSPMMVKAVFPVDDTWECRVHR